MAFPLVAEPASCFAQADGEIHYGLQPLRVDRRKAVAVAPKQLGIPENAG